MKIQPDTIEFYLSDIQDKTICDILFAKMDDVDMKYDFDSKKLFINCKLDFDNTYYQKLFFYSRIDYFNKTEMNEADSLIFSNIKKDNELDLSNPFFIKALAFSNFFMEALFNISTKSNDDLYNAMVLKEEKKVEKLFMKYKSENKYII